MKNKNKYIKAWILALLIFLTGFILIKLNVINFSNIKSIQHTFGNSIGKFKSFANELINSHGNWAPVIYIGILEIKTIFIVFPYSVMIILGGSIFGPTSGFIYSIVGIYLSASIGFWLGRFLDKRIVEKILKNRLKNLDSKVEKHGFKIIFLMRLSMLFPFDLLSFACGVAKMKYKDFILGTMLGIIPETFSLTYLGENMDNPFSYEFIIALVLVFLTAAVPFIYNKIRKKQKGL